MKWREMDRRCIGGYYDDMQAIILAELQAMADDLCASLS